LNTQRLPRRHAKAHHDIDSQIQVVLTSSFDPFSDCHITRDQSNAPGMASGTRRDNDSDYVTFKMRMRDDRKTKATKLPRVLKKLQEEDPMIEVDHPDSAAYKNFHGLPAAP
jgi:hypothetical protein